MKEYTGYIFIFLAAACWGLLGICGRFVMQHGLQPMEVAFWRAAIGGILFIFHAGVTRTILPRSLSDLTAFAMFGAVSMAGFFSSYQYAVKAGGAALASVLLYTAPAWVAISSRFFFAEKITPRKAMAIGMSLAGIICISIAGGDTGANALTSFEGNVNLTAIFFGLLAGLLYSTHYIFCVKYLRSYPSHTIYGYGALFGALTLLPFVEFSPKSVQDWLALFTLGFVCTYLAYLAYCAGLRLLAPTRAAVLATVEPVLATLFAWWIFGEVFSLSGWIGAALILCAVLTLVLASRRSSKDCSKG